MKNKTKILVPFLAAALVMLTTACKKDPITLPDIKSPTTKMVSDEKQILLGEQLNDPYDIEFMSSALSQMLDEGYEFPFTEIEPTGQYVRLFAASTADLDAIESDTTTLWFDYPLDYDLSEGGTSYHAPGIPDSATWKYAVVPMDYNFPENIEREILHFVFIPDEHPEYEQYENSFDLLEELSEKLCENTTFPRDEDVIPSGKKAKKWAPSATIRAWDDVVGGLIPLQGVKVTARRGTKCRHQFTDANGECTFAKEFKEGKNVKYGITWERGKWDIRDGWWQAYYNGPKLTTAWNLDIYGQKSLMYATIHRAAMKAYYGYFGDLQRPNLVVGKMKISYRHYLGDQLGMHWSGWHVFGLVSDIYIWGYDHNGYRKTNAVFGTTLHELAHQAHQRYMGTVQFWQVNEFVGESWARGIQCILTNQHYREELALNDRCLTHDELYSMQHYRKEIHGNYTPLFIDLIDDFNQALYYGNDYINDNISGYTLQEIQDNILGSSYGLTSCRNTLKSLKLHGETDDDIDNLFAKY